MKKLLSLLLLMSVASLSFAGMASAHGNTKPQHGGMVQMVGETVFELVMLADKVEVYLEEDGERLDSAGLSGKLIVTSNGAKSEATLEAAGGNKLEAKGAKIASGSKVTVVVMRKDQSKMSANFTVK